MFHIIRFLARYVFQRIYHKQKKKKKKIPDCLKMEIFSNVPSRLFTFLCHRTEPSFRTPLSPLSFFFLLQELETISSCCLFILTRKRSQKSRGSQCRAMQNGCLKVSASCRHALRVQDNREIARRQWRSVFAYVFRGGCNNVPVGRFHQTRLSSRSGSKTNVQPVESDTERQKGGAVVDELARITQLPALIGSSIAVGLQTPVTDSLVAVSAAARQIERNCNLEINRRLFGRSSSYFHRTFHRGIANSHRLRFFFVLGTTTNPPSQTELGRNLNL